MRAEARALARARRLGVHTPTVFFVDARASTLYLDRIAGGMTLRDVLRASSPPATPARVAGLMAGVISRRPVPSRPEDLERLSFAATLQLMPAATRLSGIGSREA